VSHFLPGPHSTTQKNEEIRMRSTATLALLGLLLGARGASADVIHVPADQPTIQAAINAAVDGDEVVIAPGTYNEDINFNGNAITVRGSGSDVTTIEGQGFSFPSVVSLMNGEGPDSILRDLTVTGGNAGSCGCAGGINAWGNPTIINCHITGNRTGAFSAPAAGGGLVGGGLVVDCTFSNNWAGSGSNIAGQAVGGGAVVGNAILINCAFVDNSVSAFSVQGQNGTASGGGLSANDSVLINCLIRGNSAGADGSARGGGVLLTGSSIMVNCLITDNIAQAEIDARGAGVSVNADAQLINCTIANNVAIGAADIGGVNVTGSGMPSLANCIVVGNTGTDVHSNAVARYSCIEGGFLGEGNIDADPLFIDPANGDFRLQDASPCRDAGSNDALPADTYDLDGDGNTAEQLSRDLDLLRRKVNGIVDMGAYEWQHACAPDIAPSSPGVAGDGIVDVDDLVAVILGWGACDQCVADINGDDVVDVDDLVLVILSWGPCR
jgi:hypothetical protein